MVGSLVPDVVDDERVVAEARDARVQLVRFLYCDLSGVTRGKTAHARRLADKLREGVGLTRAQMAMSFLEQLVPVEGMEPVGEIRLVPDPSTFSVLPWVPSSASVLCNQVGLDHQDWGADPRGFLKRMIERAGDHGIRVEASFEDEFFLAREVDGRFIPFDSAPVYSAIGLDLSADVMHDIVDALEQQGLLVEQAINEYGPGQQEIAIRHAPALRAADNQIKVRDTVRGVGLRHGLLASFAPKPFPGTVGSGAHVHFSLWDTETGRNLLYDPNAPRGLSDLGRHAIGGLLTYLPALIALTCPSYNSYRRLQPHAWSSAFTAWGFDNREAAIRVSSPFWGNEEGSFNLELKPVDNSANPYLALGGIIAAVLDGIDRSIEPGPPSEHDPANLSEAERAERGIRRLPTDPESALQQLEQDRLLTDALGEFLARAYLAVHRADNAAFAAEDEDFEIRNHFYKF
ncbi:MAG TPA: glutamine synthetase family protein [Chloroflexota bacterium]|nr:glutamine synthetase family protein [Chloroflexota bacterium]